MDTQGPVRAKCTAEGRAAGGVPATQVRQVTRLCSSADQRRRGRAGRVACQAAHVEATTREQRTSRSTALLGTIGLGQVVVHAMCCVSGAIPAAAVGLQKAFKLASRAALAFGHRCRPPACRWRRTPPPACWSPLRGLDQFHAGLRACRSSVGSRKAARRAWHSRGGHTRCCAALRKSRISWWRLRRDRDDFLEARLQAWVASAAQRAPHTPRVRSSRLTRSHKPCLMTQPLHIDTSVTHPVICEGLRMMKPAASPAAAAKRGGALTSPPACRRRHRLTQELHQLPHQTKLASKAARAASSV